MKFNLSHIVYDNDITNEDKIAIFDRMRCLSSETYLTVASWEKNIGFETINVNISKQIPNNFLKNNSNIDNKYTIIRIYTNNNPTPGRLIGKMINKIFYIFFIDVKGKLYAH